MIRNDKNHTTSERQGETLFLIHQWEKSPLQILVSFPQSGQVQTPNVLMPSSIPSPQTVLPCQKTLILFLDKNFAWPAKLVYSAVPVNDHSPKNLPAYAKAPFPLSHLNFLGLDQEHAEKMVAWLSVIPVGHSMGGSYWTKYGFLEHRPCELFASAPCSACSSGHSSSRAVADVKNRSDDSRSGVPHSLEGINEG